MAKDQSLSLNPAKISGLCGRLMCCLKFENDTYENAQDLFPDIGESVRTPDGNGRVVLLNLLERKVQVELVDSGIMVEHSLNEVDVRS
jgi:cell fate regulator YaaT (PSP1 superfamily)